MAVTNRSRAGQLAQSVGDLAERLVELSFKQYGGLVSWVKTYPETKTVFDRKTGQQRTFLVEDGNGPPDYCVSLAPSGRLLWLEVKTWGVVEQHLYKKRLHQYWQMRDAIHAGALGFYLIYWRWHGSVEWRLYQVDDLERKDGGLLFLRSSGLLVPVNGEIPDWLSVLNSERTFEK